MHMMLRVQRCLASQAAMGGEDADLLGELAMEPPPEQATATGSASTNWLEDRFDEACGRQP